MTTTTPTTPAQKDPTTCGRCQQSGVKEPRALVCPTCTPAARAAYAAQKDEAIGRYLAGALDDAALWQMLTIHRVLEQALAGAHHLDTGEPYLATDVGTQIVAYLADHPWPTDAPATPAPGFMTRGRRLLALARVFGLNLR